MSELAASAERVVSERYFGSLSGLPGTMLARPQWPLRHTTNVFGIYRPWHYWWQAHLLDCLVDAQQRAPSQYRRARIKRLVRTIFLRNRLSWTNSYYDDMAWLGLALQRVHIVTGYNARRPIRTICAQLRLGWTLDAGGGIWWRRDDDYKNAPTNGPAGIFHYRNGDSGHAREILHWLDNTLVDSTTGVVLDGIHARSGNINRDIFTYCQGVFLGLAVELSEVDLCNRTIRAIDEFCTVDGVIRGHGGGDGGLFGGILARYLAFAVTSLPRLETAEVAKRIVLNSAESCIEHVRQCADGPLFGPEWLDVTPSVDEQSDVGDLSVQLGAWMLLEAAAKLGA